VTGEVRQPGAIALSGPLSLVECLARAGSTTEHAGREAIVARPPRGSDKSGPTPFDGTSEIIRVDIGELQRGVLTHNLALRDGDTVFIPRAATVHVMGQVKSAGEYPIFHGTTVAEIVSRAGGVTDRGSIGRVRVIRVVNGRKKELKARFDDLLQPGDVLVVRERVF
jgi:polysaccharide biosynthesis/export protein